MAERVGAAIGAYLLEVLSGLSLSSARWGDGLLALPELRVASTCLSAGLALLRLEECCAASASEPAEE